MWSWLRNTTSSPASPISVHPYRVQGPHAHCDDCEFSFFNHAATLPFDQGDECQCVTHHRKPTASEDR